MECPGQPQITLKSNCSSVISGNVTRRIPLKKKQKRPKLQSPQKVRKIWSFPSTSLVKEFQLSKSTVLTVHWALTAAGLGHKASCTWTLSLCSWPSGDVLTAHLCLLLQSCSGHMASDWKVFMETQFQNCPCPRLLQIFPLDTPLVLD